MRFSQFVAALLFVGVTGCAHSSPVDGAEDIKQLAETTEISGNVADSTDGKDMTKTVQKREISKDALLEAIVADMENLRLKQTQILDILTSLSTIGMEKHVLEGRRFLPQSGPVKIHISQTTRDPWDRYGGLIGRKKK